MPCRIMLVGPGALIDGLEQVHVNAAAGTRRVFGNRFQQWLRTPLHAGGPELHIELRAGNCGGDGVGELDVVAWRHRRANEQAVRSCLRSSPRRGRREPVRRRHRRPDSGRAPRSQRRCGCRRRQPLPDRLGLVDQRQPAAWPGAMDHHRRAPCPRRTRQRGGRGRGRDRAACRARIAGSSFPAACRQRRTTMRSAAHDHGH